MGLTEIDRTVQLLNILEEELILNIRLQINYRELLPPFLFLLGLNVFNQKALLWLAGFYFLPVMYAIKTGKMPVDNKFCLIALTMISYLFLTMLYETVYLSVAIVFLGMPFAYLTGRIYGKHIAQEDFHRKLYCLLLVLVLGLVLYNLLSYTTGANISSNSVIDARFVADYWTGELVHPTNFNSRICYAIGFSFFAFFYVGKITTFITLVFLQLFTLFISIQTASRTNLLLMALVFMFSLILHLFVLKNKPNDSKDLKSINRMRAIAMILIIITTVIFMGDITKWYADSQLVERLALGSNTNNIMQGVSEDGRWELWREVISQMSDYPFGNMPTSMYAHNLFLDTYRSTGIIPTVLIIVFFIASSKTVIRFIKNGTIQSKTKCLVFSFIVCGFCSFMVEPVIEGRPLNLAIFCMLIGIMEGCLNFRKGWEI